MSKRNFEKNKISEIEIRNIAIEYLRDLGYNILDFEVPIDFGKLKKRADIIVYSIENDKKTPFIVVETKYKIEDFAWIQVESYAKRLNAPFFAVTDGDEWLWYKTEDKLGESEPIDVSYITKASSKDNDYLITFESQDAFLSIINECYDIIWFNKNYGKIELVNELIKLILVKLKDEKNTENRNKSNREFVINQNDTVISVSDRIKELFENLKDDYPQIYPNNLNNEFSSILLDDDTIYDIVRVIEPYKFTEEKKCDNFKGLFFEIFLRKTVKSESYTPKEISKFMVDMVDPKFGESVLDPACGTGTLIIDVTKKICDEIKASFTETANKDLVDYIEKNINGIEINDNFFWLTLMNMVFHDFEIGNIVLSDALTKTKKNEAILNNQYDVIITNPPIGRIHHELNSELLDNDLNPIRLRYYEELFLYNSINLLKPSGKLGIILPNSLLDGAYPRQILDYIKNETNIKAIISLPERKFNNIQCSFLYLEKKGINNQQGPVFVVNPKEIKYNELKQHFNIILDKYKHFKWKKDIKGNIEPLDDKKLILGINKDLIFSRDNISPANFDYEYLSWEEKLNNIEKRTIKQISKKIRSGFYSKQLILKDSGPIPFIRMSNVEKGTVLFEDITFVDEEPFEGKFSRIMHQGNIIIPRFVNVDKITILPIDYENYIIDQSYFGIELKDSILPKYLLLFLKSKYGTMQLEMLKRGGTIPFLNKSILENIIVPIHPIDTQVRVIGVIEDVEEMEKKNKKIIANLEKELNDYLKEKVGLSLSSNDISEYQNNKDYNFKKLGELVVFSDERIKFKKQSNYKYIKVNNIKDGKISSYSSISGIKAKNRDNKVIRKGQIILPLLENYLSNVSIVPTEFDSSVVSNSFSVLEINEEYLKYFIFYYLNTSLAQSQLKNLIRGSVIKSIPSNSLEKILVPLPDKDVLNEISKKIKDTYEIIDNLKAEYIEKMQNAENEIEKIFLEGD